jgi:hypothetical protein
MFCDGASRFIFPDGGVAIIKISGYQATTQLVDMEITENSCLTKTISEKCKVDPAVVG